MLRRLEDKILQEPLYRSLKEAFEEGGWDLFSITGLWEAGDILGEAEAIAASASEAVPCDSCGADVKAHPRVGWAIIVFSWARVKGVRLCLPCAEALHAEEAAREAPLEPPWVENLVVVRTTDWSARNWGVFRPESAW
jgi:hypothetical protein